MTSVAETMPDDQGGGGGFLARLKAQAIEYSQISTMHGLRYIGEVERPTFERLASSSNSGTNAPLCSLTIASAIAWIYSPQS